MATATRTAERIERTAEAGRSGWLVVLAVIVLVEMAVGFLYVIGVPRWQAPDEPAHYNYVRYIAETGALPVLQPGDYNADYLEQIKAAHFPPSMSIAGIRYEMYQPPLYYLAAAPLYLAAQAAGIDPVLILRLLSVALGGLILVLAYRVLAALFPAHPLLTVAGVAFMATVPMNIAMWAAINADPLAELLIAVLLLIAFARALREWSDRRFIIIGGVVYGLALLTSTKAYPAFVLLLLAEAAHTRFERRNFSASARRLFSNLFRVFAPLFLISLVISGWWFVRNALVYGGLDIFGWGMHDRVVAGQLTTGEWIANIGIRNAMRDFTMVTLKSFWAQFGWMGVLVSDRIYVLLYALSALAAFGAALWSLRQWRERGKELRGRGWLWTLMMAWLAIILLAHVWYNIRYVQPQGRYLFPALIPIAAFFVTGLYELLDKRYVRLVMGLLYLALLALDVVSLYGFIIPQLAGG